MRPLWISNDPYIIEEKEKLINRKGGGVGAIPCILSFFPNLTTLNPLKFINTLAFISSVNIPFVLGLHESIVTSETYYDVSEPLNH